jgi:hypothetical protein
MLLKMKRMPSSKIYKTFLINPKKRPKLCNSNLITRKDISLSLKKAITTCRIPLINRMINLQRSSQRRERNSMKKLSSCPLRSQKETELFFL